MKQKKFILDIGELIEDPDTKDKFITITLNKKILHLLFESLAKYKGGLSNVGSDKKEKDDITQLNNELVEVNDVLNNEVVVKRSGKQEPNPVEQTVGL